MKQGKAAGSASASLQGESNEERSASEYWLGRYLMSLTPNARSVCGHRVKIIGHFIDTGCELTKAGYQEYIKTNAYLLTKEERKILTDFLYFAGVRRLGGRRKERGKIVEKIETLTEASKKKITAYLEWAQAQRDYSDNSIRIKRDQMSKFFKYFTEFNLANCRDFIATQEHEGKHPKTLNMYMMTLKQYGEFVKKPVTLKKISIQRSMSVENVPTEKEYQGFLEWLKNNEKWQMYWIVKVLGSTGMRKSELNQLTWADILSGEFYPLCKGKKRRMIYFPKTLVRELKEWLKTHPTETSRQLIISKRYDKPLSDRGFSEILKFHADKAGFPKEKAHCHAFRHFFAKQFLTKTKDVIQLAELLGHESVDTTRLYLQKSKAEQARDVNKYITW